MRLPWVSFESKGLKLQDIRLSEFELQTDNIDINLLKILFGEVELNQPINASTRIVLKEADINQALKLELVRKLLQEFLTFYSEKSIVSIYPQDVKFRLPGNNQIIAEGEIILDSNRKKRPLGFKADVILESLEKPIVLNNFKCNTPQGLELEIVVALIDKIHKLRQSPYFEFKDAALRINALKVQQGSIILLAQAHLQQISENIFFEE